MLETVENIYILNCTRTVVTILKNESQCVNMYNDRIVCIDDAGNLILLNLISIAHINKNTFLLKMFCPCV